MPNSSSTKLTVLMPAYNAGQYIREAVDSVLAQTFRDFELLIINDGSTDDTAAILATYSDDRIRVIHQENIRLVATLNKGIGLAKTDWIARFDADDICYPQRLEKQMAFLQQNEGYVLIGSEADYVDETGNYIFTYRFKTYDDDEIRASGFKYCPVIHSSVIFSKKAVLAAGGYDENAITFEDHLLWRNLSAFGKIKNLHEPLIKVRFNPNSVTIDEKWRGKDFIELKERSIQTGKVSQADLVLLKQVLKSQDFAHYKKAAYHSMLGKKFLWNSHNSTLARQHLRKAISKQPQKLEPYLLYLLSFLPASLIKYIYNTAKK